MKKYVKQTTNTVHYIADIRREFPNVSIPDDADCSEFGYEFLLETPAPQQDGYYAVEVAPVDNVQTWELRQKAVEVPRVITPRQARLKLFELGLLDGLEAIITTNRAWKIEWEYATEVRRDSPLIDAVASQEGMTSEQIDQLFVEAAAL